MKKLLFSFLIGLAFLFQPTGSHAQFRLFVDSIDGIVNPVVEGDPYTLSFHVQRSDSDATTFFGDVFILIRSESVGLTDTMGIFTQITLPQYGDTTLIDTFTFESSSFDGGDNIVVVWPASTTSITPDTLHTHVNFSSISVEEYDPRQLFTLFPNPASRFLNLRYTDPEKVEQVRVSDILGKDLLAFGQAVSTVDIRPLASGIYFIEVRHKNGLRATQRIIIE